MLDQYLCQYWLHEVDRRCQPWVVHSFWVTIIIMFSVSAVSSFSHIITFHKKLFQWVPCIYLHNLNVRKKENTGFWLVLGISRYPDFKYLNWYLERKVQISVSLEYLHMRVQYQRNVHIYCKCLLCKRQYNYQKDIKHINAVCLCLVNDLWLLHGVIKVSMYILFGLFGLRS